MMNKLFLFAFLLFGSNLLISQNVTLSGYIYDSELKNRMDEVLIKIYFNDVLLDSIESGDNGEFDILISKKGIYELKFSEEAHIDQSYNFNTSDKLENPIAISMIRFPGYEFIGTIKELLPDEIELGELVKDTRIEIYNYTTDSQVLNIFLQPKATFKFTFKSGYHYTVMIRKKGYLTKRFEIIVNADGCTICTEGLGNQNDSGIIGSASKEDQRGLLLTDIPFRKIKINEAIELENIYYDYNKWNIRSNARPSLDRLVQIMRATPIIIELGSHTDSRGKEEYNMELSQKRAESAVSYIISRGIDSKRITAQGYGESIPVNQCIDGVTCTEAEHQENRRTEFKVTKIMTTTSFDDKTLKDIIEIEKTIKKRATEEWDYEK